ncbi:Protein of unknown function, partial [Gryllus bimaculatus]
MGQHHQWNANHVDQCQRHESLLSIKDVGTIHQQVRCVVRTHLVSKRATLVEQLRHATQVTHVFKCINFINVNN